MQTPSSFPQKSNQSITTFLQQCITKSSLQPKEKKVNPCAFQISFKDSLTVSRSKVALNRLIFLVSRRTSKPVARHVSALDFLASQCNTNKVKVNPAENTQ